VVRFVYFLRLFLWPLYFWLWRLWFLTYEADGIDNFGGDTFNQRPQYEIGASELHRIALVYQIGSICGATIRLAIPEYSTHDSRLLLP